MNRYRVVSQVLLPMFAAVVFSTTSPATAQRAAPGDAWPSKTIRMVIPYAAGGAPDVVGRALAEKVGASVGQAIVLDNRGGGGGMVGTAVVAKSPPDGYTMLLQAAGFASYPFFYKNVPYDSEKDLVPVTLVAKAVGFVLVVSPNSPFNSVADVVAYAKANPGRLNFGTAGRGSPMQLAGELFAQLAGVQMTPIHYTGVPQALTDIIGGRTDLGFPNAASALTLIQGGKLKTLGISAEKRWDKLREVPTMHEAGVAGMKFVGWYGLWFPAGTPKNIVDRMQVEVARAMTDPVIRKRMEDQALEGVGSSQADFVRTIQEEFDLNRRLAAKMGIVPE